MGTTLTDLDYSCRSGLVISEWTLDPGMSLIYLFSLSLLCASPLLDVLYYAKMQELLVLDAVTMALDILGTNTVRNESLFFMNYQVSTAAAEAAH